MTTKHQLSTLALVALALLFAGAGFTIGDQWRQAVAELTAVAAAKPAIAIDKKPMELPGWRTIGYFVVTMTLLLSVHYSMVHFLQDPWGYRRMPPPPPLPPEAEGAFWWNSSPDDAGRPLRPNGDESGPIRSTRRRNADQSPEL